MIKSGVEMLEELLEEIKTLHKKVDLLDRNIKEIANSAKVADLLDKAMGTKLDTFARAGGKASAQKVDAKSEIARIKEQNQQGMRFKFEPTDASKIKRPVPAAQKSRAAGPKNIMVKGKMIVMSGQQTIPLANVNVTIFNSKDAVVKETKTNRAGHWMSQLSPGKYVAKFEGEYAGQKLIPMNKAFEVPTTLPEGQTEIEVK